jgi:hypothetical protein
MRHLSVHNLVIDALTRRRRESVAEDWSYAKAFTHFENEFH